MQRSICSALAFGRYRLRPCKIVAREIAVPINTTHEIVAAPNGNARIRAGDLVSAGFGIVGSVRRDGSVCRERYGPAVGRFVGVDSGGIVVVRWDVWLGGHL